MPYYIVSREVKVEAFESGCVPEYESDCSLLSMPYDSRQSAQAHTTSDSHVIFLATSAEDTDWRYRERMRFYDAKYQHIPWHRCDEYPDHYCHISLDDPTMIAFTASTEHGVQNRKTRMSPGRYLTRFYTDYTHEWVTSQVHACTALTQDYKVARDTDTIVAIYSGLDTGYSSCMQRKHCIEYDWQRGYDDGSRLHPVSVYGESDLAVAYRGTPECATQRAVIWPDKKTYCRIYGSGPLEAMLKRDGYTESEPDGAKIRYITYPRAGYVYMPYIDGIDCAEPSGEWLILGQGSMSCSETNGRAYVTHTQRIEDRDSYRFCDHCDSGYDTDDEGDGEYCQSCLDSQTVCEICDRAVFECVTIYGRPDNPDDVSRIDICENCQSDDEFTQPCLGCNRDHVERIHSTRLQRESLAAGYAGYCDRCIRNRQHIPVDPTATVLFWQQVGYLGNGYQYLALDTITDTYYSVSYSHDYTLLPCTVSLTRPTDRHTRVHDPRITLINAAHEVYLTSSQSEMPLVSPF